MSEEIKKSVFKAFAQAQQTYVEAEEKAKQEAGTPKVERFRTGEDGEYAIRVLPLAPVLDEEGNIQPMDRKGYEYPIHQQFLSIEAPSKKDGKKKKINIPVIRTTDKQSGYSVDLIDTYVKIAKEMYGDDDDLMELINSSGFNGGLKWNYSHAIMVLDVSSDKERAKGPQLWQCSHSQYKTLDGARLRLWKELRNDDENAPCPISSFTEAYPVNIIRKTEKKTEYTIEIGRRKMGITEDEAMKLLDLPRIPDLIYRYTRYQMEATLAFLQQYDEKHGMEVCKEPDFKEAIDKLQGELPADDTSHFDLKSTSSKAGSKEDVSIDSLWAEYDAISDQGLGEKSDEYQDLREKIHQFIVDNNLDVRVAHSKNNQQLLEEVEEALESAEKSVPAKEAETKTPSQEKGERTPAPVRKAVVDEPEEEEDDEPEAEPEQQVEEEPVRRRRPRPGSQETEKESEPADEPAQEPAEDPEPPRRRLHTRRLR